MTEKYQFLTEGEHAELLCELQRLLMKGGLRGCLNVIADICETKLAIGQSVPYDLTIPDDDGLPINKRDLRSAIRNLRQHDLF